MRLLLDELVGPRVAEQLQEHGDVVAVASSAALRAQPDEALLEVAAEHGRVLVTRNVSDVARLDAEWQAAGRRHSGPVMVAERAPQSRNLVGALVAALRQVAERGSLPGGGEVLFLRPPIATQEQ